MKLIESKAEYLPQASGLEGIYKQIELCGRTCYKSTDKITDESAMPFVNKMIASNHTAMLEQGTVYLMIPCDVWRAEEHEWLYMFPEGCHYFSEDCDGKFHYITTNLRYIIEANIGITTMQKYFCEPTDYHEKRYTFKLTTDRGVSHELVRHRVMSFAQESTRYCNYSKGKFGSELTFIIPSWYDKYDSFLLNEFDKHLERTESLYMWMMEKNMAPQEARQILPNAIKTEICMTGFASDWRFFFDLRLFGKTGKPHPDMLLLAEKAKKVAEEAGIWDDIMKYPSKFD